MNAGQRDNGLLDTKLRSTVLMEDGGTHVSILASLTETTHLMILRQLVVNLYTAANKAVLRENQPLPNANFNQKWSGIRIQIARFIQTRMSATSLPKCCGFITLSVSVILPSFVKFRQWPYEKF